MRYAVFGTLFGRGYKICGKTPRTAAGRSVISEINTDNRDKDNCAVIIDGSVENHVTRSKIEWKGKKDTRVSQFSITFRNVTEAGCKIDLNFKGGTVEEFFKCARLPDGRSLKEYIDGQGSTVQPRVQTN